MKKKQKSIYLMSGIGCLLLFCAILAYFFLTPLSKSGQTEYLYVDNDDTVDSVFVKLSRIGNNHAISGMKTLTKDKDAIVALYQKGYRDAEAIGSFI